MNGPKDVAVDRSQRGSALIVALLLTVLLFSLGAALLTMSEAESVIAANDQHAEGAFMAAEAAVQVMADQIQPSVDTSTLVVATTSIGESYAYRSGRREDASAQPPELIGTGPAAGFAVGANAGYANSGFVFEIYEINGTGTGPRNAIREVELQLEVGPVSR